MNDFRQRILEFQSEGNGLANYGDITSDGKKYGIVFQVCFHFDSEIAKEKKEKYGLLNHS